jgi:hypothetical protein
MYIRIYVYMYICIYVYMYIRITKYNMYIYICIYVLQNIKYHVYIHIYVCWSGLTQYPKKKKTPQLSFHHDGTNLFT